MDRNNGQDTTDDKVKSFTQGKWFPVAIAGLALAISIGGHTFTAFNSVGFVTASNKIDSIESTLSQTVQANDTQDRAIQTLHAQLTKALTDIQLQNDVIAKLRKNASESKHDSTALPAGYKSVREEAVRQTKAAEGETAPLVNGVNKRFDTLIRSRMKPHFDPLPVRVGEDKIDDDDMVVLQFQVDRQGAIQDVQVASSSGQIELDNSAVKAALRMNSIPEIAGLNDQAYAQVRNFRLGITPSHMR
ncbi:energy transducer TonB [Pseudomonas tritici]|uniref:energy transducer TonB n=1 Tax=Pseudomonas tritici TaxID=2745518 RepID=UPI00387B4988